MLTLAHIGFDAPRALLSRYGLELVEVADGEPIPGSYWGECEAGLIGPTVYARADTPVHSLLHEAGHLLLLPHDRRAAVHTDATDCQHEEDAVCVLQALLGDALPGVGRERIWADMDEWGYTFRLGSSRAFFERDAEEAFALLRARGLLGPGGIPCLATLADAADAA
jgi:hypothetical protein